MAGVKDGTARTLDTATGKELAVFKGSTGKVGAVAFSSDGRLVATGSFDNTARVFAAADGKPIATIKHDDVVNSVALSPDGHLFATGSYDHSVQVFDLAAGKQVSEFRLSRGSAVDTVVFSPDGHFVIVGTGGSDRKIRTIEAATGKELWSAPADTRVGGIAFSPDGRYLVVAIENHVMRDLSEIRDAGVFDIASGEQTAHLSLENLRRLSFNPENSDLVVASGGRDQSVIELASFLFRMSDLANDLCARLNRDLTPEERKQYLPNIPAEKICSEAPRS